MIETFDISGKRGNIISQEKSKFWIDLTNPTKEELKKLEETLKIDKGIINTLTREHQRPRIEQYGNLLTVTIRGTKTEKVGTSELISILNKNFLVTIHKQEFNILKEIKNDKQLIKELLTQGCDSLLHKITEELIEDYFSLIEKLDKELDTLENQALTDVKSTQSDVLKRLFKIKNSLIKLRKTLYPQREIMSNLSNGNYVLISQDSKLRFRNTQENMTIITELIEDQRETISNILEVHLSVTSNRLNEVMKILTIFATVLMPMTFIASIYGMNFKYMPELEWRYGYLFSIILMVTALIVILFYLKKKRWV